MKRSLLLYALLATSAALLAAQENSQSGAYSGTSTPPPDTSIVTDEPAQDHAANPAGATGYEQPAPIPIPKPSPAQTMPQTMPQTMSAPAPQPAPMAAPMNRVAPASMAPNPADGTDDGIVAIATDDSAQPELNQRGAMRRDPMMSDPDGDIVHPEGRSQYGGGYGATIRVHLLEDLSAATSQTGERFRTRVASDVIQDGQILIPAGSELDGTVVGVSYGHALGHGSMHLRPEEVILPDGSRFHIYAELSGAPGSSVHINGEGGVSAGSRLKKDGIEYGAGVGAGAITGAILGGPGGALAGTIIGAGAVTVHLLVSHPQARLDSGSVLLFTLNQPLNLVPAAQSGN